MIIFLEKEKKSIKKIVEIFTNHKTNEQKKLLF